MIFSLPSNDSKISVLLLLYLFAAFDTKDHEILSRLKRDFGIRGTALSRVDLTFLTGNTMSS